jgi:hypothetical protein
LEKEPEQRYQHASEVKTQVETILTTPPTGEQKKAAAFVPKGRFGRVVLVGACNGKRAINWTGVIQTWVVLYGAMLIGLYLAFGRSLPLHDLIASIAGGVTLVTAALVKVDLKKPMEQLTSMAVAEAKPRISRTAIVGACWATFGLFLLSAGVATGMIRDYKLQTIELFTIPQVWVVFLFVMGTSAPFCTTILGWIAVSQIRRSAGKLYGLGLAVFDGLLFPLIAMDGAIAGLWLVLAKLFARFVLGLQNSLFFDVWDATIWILLALASAASMDYLMIRRVWRAVNQPVAAPASTVQKPDRFWRWFAVTVVALIASPFVIAAVLVILNPLLIVFFEPHDRAQRVNQPNAQDAAAMPEQQVLAEFDWSKLAVEGRILGGVPVTVGDNRPVLKIENTSDTPLHLPLLKIEKPAITALKYAVTGEIKYESVRGDGYLEMWNDFAADGRFFTRTLSPAGSGLTGKISGTSRWRAFTLPFSRSRPTNAPTQLEINIFLPGHGVVFLGPMKLVQWAQGAVPGVEPVVSSPTFGPVIERVLPLYGLIDFDTGNVSGPENTDPAAAQMRLKGNDAYLAGNSFIWYDAGITKVSAEEWENLMVSELKRRLEANGTWNGFPITETPKTMLMFTRGFQTREGSVGILQITGDTDSPRGVKLRYKLGQQTK